jgi:hypothetical protein
VKVYVAGSSKQLDRVKHWMDKLQAAGHTVTHDWPSLIEAVGSANPPDATRDECWDWAIDDLKGVRDAEVLWFLVPETEGAGAWVELGYALARQIPVVCSGVWSRSIFTSMTTCYDRDDLAFEAEFAHPLTFECTCPGCLEANGFVTGVNW